MPIYVGVPHAEIMSREGMSLEEYTDFLRQFPYGSRPFRICCGRRSFSVSYIEAAGEGISLFPHDFRSLSGNNADGFIITEWRDADA